MEKKQFQEALEELRKTSPKRKFKQSVEIIVNLRDLDLKRNDQQIDFFATLPHDKGKEVKVCALVGPELYNQAKETCDFAINTDTFNDYQEPKTIKKLADQYQFF